MLLTRCLILSFVLFIILDYSRGDFIPDETEKYQEGIYNIRYKRLVEETMFVLIRGEKIYIPLSRLLNMLKIYNEWEMEKNLMKGYFLDKNLQYAIDFGGNNIRLFNKKLSFLEDDYVIFQREPYVEVNKISSWFGFDMKVNHYMLEVYVQSNAKLPIDEYIQRKDNKVEYDPFETLTLSDKNKKIHRKKSLISGGVIDYSLLKGSDNQRHAYDLTIGNEFIKGEFKADLSGYYNGEGKIFNEEKSFYWRYVAPSEWLKQIKIGKNVTSGAKGEWFEGLVLTNEPYSPRDYLTTYKLILDAEPESEVEVYLNRRLYKIESVKDDGRIEINIPLFFGTNNILYKIYGPAGNYTEKEKMIQIPFQFVPRGKLDYQLSIGKTRKTGDFISQGKINLGLTDYLTFETGVDYFTYEKKEAYSQCFAFNGRFFDSQLLSLKIYPSQLWSFGGYFYHHDYMVNFDYSNFHEQGFYNQGGLISSRKGRFYTPSFKEFLNSRFIIHWTWNRYEFFNSNRVSINYSYSILGCFIQWGYESYRYHQDISFIQDLDNERKIVFNMLRMINNGPSLLKRSLFQLRLGYRNECGKLDDVSLTWSKRINKRSQIKISYQRDDRYHCNQFQFQVNFVFPSLRVNSSLKKSIDSERVLRHHFFKGSISCDIKNKTLIFSNRDKVGKGTTVFRFFEDSNNNKKYDVNEKLIPRGRVEFNKYCSIKEMNDGLVYAQDLNPYQYYSGLVDLSKLNNPLMTSLINEVSFISIPNKIQYYDIPLYPTGIIDGTVSFVDKHEKKGIPGIRLLIKEENEETGVEKVINTFSDGSFYKIDLKPGKYRIWIDKRQIASIEGESIPKEYRFEVKLKSHGDYIENLNFIIKK